MIHCAKLEISLIDASSGKYFGESHDTFHSKTSGVRSSDFMKTFIKQNVQNSMYFDELGLNEVFQMQSHSRYLFLEFLEDFSLILVGNQGSYDLHLFKLTNIITDEGCSKYKLQREYIYKAGTNNRLVRILGVSVCRLSPDCNRIYILSSEHKVSVLEVRKRDR